MSKGRPKKKEKRTVIVKVRLTEEEAEVLETASKILKRTKSDLLREQIVSLRTHTKEA